VHGERAKWDSSGRDCGTLSLWLLWVFSYQDAEELLLILLIQLYLESLHPSKKVFMGHMKSSAASVQSAGFLVLRGTWLGRLTSLVFALWISPLLGSASLSGLGNERSMSLASSRALCFLEYDLAC